MRVGTVCIGQHFMFDTGRNGMECLIIGALENRECDMLVLGSRGMVFGCRVQWADGAVRVTKPKHLRPKRPPGEQSIMELFKHEPQRHPAPVP